jgi:hypothetical protein
MGWWAFDDKKVRAYIDDAMKKNATWTPIDIQLRHAFKYLFELRGSTDPKDDNRELAAAEHYMYARWQVCSGETKEEVMRIMVVGYESFKVATDLSAYVIRKVAGYSWSRPSIDSIRWGKRGCDDGHNDAWRITRDPDERASPR